MLDKNRKYKGYDFSDTVQKNKQVSDKYSIVIQNVDYTMGLSTEVFENANYHGGYSSPTLAKGGRLFTFSGQIAATSKEKRAEAWRELCNIIKIESNPNALGRGFYDLERQTGDDQYRTVKAKVYSLPKPSNGLMDPIVGFTFELFVENEKIYGLDTHIVEGSIGYLGGTTLPMTLPKKSKKYVNVLTLENSGNHEAPLRIDIIGTCHNPKIVNITNGYKYRLDATTTSLVVDNTNLDNDPAKKFIVTDLGNNIKAKRNSGADIFLSPGINELVVLSDDSTDNPVVRVRFRDTYSS